MFGHPALSAEFYNYLLNIEFVAAVGSPIIILTISIVNNSPLNTFFTTLLPHFCRVRVSIYGIRSSYVNGSDFWPKCQILKLKFLNKYLIISDEKCIKFQEKMKFLQKKKFMGIFSISIAPRRNSKNCPGA